MTIACGIQPTSVVTMAKKVLHNTCNTCSHDLPDVNASSLGPVAFGLQAYISGKFPMPILQSLHAYMYLNQNTPGVKKVAAKNLKKGCTEKDVKSKWAPRPPAVDGI